MPPCGENGFQRAHRVLLQYPIMTRYSIGENLKNEKCLQFFANQLNNNKMTGSLWRFYIYTQLFITRIVKDSFGMCLVGNIRLKSQSMGVDMI